MNTMRTQGTDRTYGAEPLREADVSITIKGLMHGADAMVTLRGRDLDAVLEKCDVALERLDNSESLPAQDMGRSNGVPTNGHTGYPPRGAQHYCAFHNTALRRFAKGNRVWFSHQ